MRTLVLAAMAVVPVLVAPARAEPMQDGRRIAGTFLRGDAAALWSEMTPELQQALGAPETLAALREELARSHGSEQQVLAERVSDASGSPVYERVSRWRDGTPAVQLVVTLGDGDRISGFLVRPLPPAAESGHLDYRTRAALRLPFEGAWQVFWGGREVWDNYHAADRGQRFALDFVLRRDGQSHAGDAAVLENYHCWDQPILAPADAVVAAVVDGLADQPIGRTDADNPAGNHVVLDFGAGEFGFLAHLRRGSVAVSEGQRITVGTEVGRCGNSGNTSEPHLHFHLQTTPRLGDGEGLPAQFTDYRADGTPVARGEPVRGQTVEAD